MLRDIRIGATLFVINKKEKTIGQAEVLQIAPSTPQFQYSPNGGVMPPRQTIAIRARFNGKELVFNNLYADQSSCEDSGGNGIVVCENKDSLLAEIKAFKTNNDNIISRMDEFKENSKWCDDLLTELDPVKQAEAQNAQQVEAIKKEFAGILSQQNAKIDELKSLVSQALGGSSSKGKEK